jgi:nucleotide-binding universal stress UspA family protein
MRALVWITESSWQPCIDQARELVPAGAEVTLLHVAASDIENLAEHPGPERLGRHRRPPKPPEHGVRAIADSEAQALLQVARERFGRAAETMARRGRIEREVLEAADGFDLLVLARDGRPRREPKSISHYARFIVDHAGCPVLLVWAEPPPGLGDMHWPPHLRR